MQCSNALEFISASPNPTLITIFSIFGAANILVKFKSLVSSGAIFSLYNLSILGIFIVSLAFVIQSPHQSFYLF